MMRVLVMVTGANGMLGTELCRQLRGAGHAVVATDLHVDLDGKIHPLDVTNAAALKLMADRKKPDWVFHLAAETNVDLCEQDPEHAHRVNAGGTINVAEICRTYDLPMVYISTAAVFDGTQKKPYTESDRPAPVNVYGRTKLEGEHVVAELLRRYFIFRAGWMVGGWSIDKKFVYKIVRQILEGARQIKAVNDKFGCPTFTDDFAANLLEVIPTRRYGLYHMCGKGSCSRFEIARKIVEIMGLEKEVTVVPVPSSDFPLPAPRPDSEVMANARLEDIGLNRMQPWPEALEKYILTSMQEEAPSGHSVSHRTPAQGRS